MGLESAAGFDDVREAALARATLRRVMLRIVPFSCLIFVISFMDRSNVSYAALQMNKDIGLGFEAFGFAAGIFFISYLACEIPSNFALRRYGARVWLARIQLTWGMVAILSAFVRTRQEFYVARFLLGAAEAGLIPGLIAYFNYWFRLRQLALVSALLGAGVPIAYIISGPLSTWIMTNVSLFGLSGWRSMMILEAVPALVTAVFSYVIFTERPEQATWLTEEQRHWLITALAAENRQQHHLVALRPIQVLFNPAVLLLGVIYLLFQFGNFGIGMWLPQIFKGAHSGLSDIEIGWLSAAPYLAALILPIFWAQSSDRTGERRFHAASAAILASAGLALAAYTVDNLALSMVVLSLSLTGFYAFKAPFNTLPRAFLDRDAAVIAFAVIATLGNLGSFAGPYVFGIVRKHSDDATQGLLLLAGCTAVAGLLTLVAGKSHRAAGEG